jgi:hypothetical protein
MTRHTTALATVAVTALATGCDATTWLAERLAAVGAPRSLPSEEPVVLGAAVTPVETGAEIRPDRTERLPERTRIPELADPGLHESGVAPDPALEELWDCPMCGMG